MLIEIDVDGVVANIHGGLNKPVSKKFGVDFDGERDLKTWGMHEVGEEKRKFIFELFKTPQFIGDLKPLDDAIDALISINKLIEHYGCGQIVFNTNIADNCVDIRSAWLDDIIKKTGITATKIVNPTYPKAMLRSFIVVEDNLDNLNRSKAFVKILVRRGHNRSVTSNDIVQTDVGEVYIVGGLGDIMPILDRHLKSYANLKRILGVTDDAV